MPTPAETIVRFLTARGWQEEVVYAGSARDARLTYRGKSCALELDHRPARNEMWLWLLAPGDKRCLGLPYGNALEPVLAKVVQMQDELSIGGYLGHYMALQSVCAGVTIIAWEQFSEQNGPSVDPARLVKQAQTAAQLVESGLGGDADPVVFPGQRVAKLSDYVAVIKGMQKGDMMGALAKYGLDMMSWGQVAAAWGQKMAADPTLTAKFGKLMQS